MANTRFVHAFVAAGSAAILAGCGGGGGSGSSPAPGVPSGPSRTTECSAATPQSFQAVTQRRVAARGGSSGVVPDRLYLTYRAGTRGAESALRSLGATRTLDLTGQGESQGHRVVSLAAGTDLARASAVLRNDPDVVDVAPLHYRHVQAGVQVQDPCVNDPLADNDRQWYLFRTVVAATTGANDAWSISHGTGITIAVVDTGVDETNPDLSGKFTVKERVVGGVVTSGAGSVQDSDGHGTNVAGLAVAQPNNGYGFAGVGWDVKLMAFKVFPDSTPTTPDPTADTGDEAKAIRDAVDMGASVISISLGGAQSGGIDTAERDAVAYANAHSVTVVAAAGNEYPGADGNQPDYPAAYPGVIAVGASAVDDGSPDTYSTILDDKVASYSNSGPTLVAPGGDACPGTTGNNTCSDDDRLHWIEGYDTTTSGVPANQCSNSPVAGQPVCAALFAGTSQATPQVAGIVALMMAKHGGPRSLTPTQVQSILRASSHLIPGIAAGRQGAGLIDAHLALQGS